MTQRFFEERSDQSEVKARIVTKYFSAWANIVVGTAQQMDGKIAYIDLYAGPGRYRDGAASTPLLVLQTAIANKRFRESLITMFNDNNSDNSNTLEGEIAKLPGVKKLKHAPIVECNEVGHDAEKFFCETGIVPSFTFFDPFGYKGLSLQLVNGVIKDWGCDCLFFFNYNRINAGISNPLVKEHMNALFGKKRAKKLRRKVKGVVPKKRQTMVLQGLSKALHEMGGKFVLPFRFRSPNGRLTHHLVFVSKNFKGYEVMKEIMSGESSSSDQGVASFTYSPADRDTPLLFELQRPLDDLEEMLESEYAGRTISVYEIYREHSVGRPYLKKHYKSILLKLEQASEITVSDPENKKRRKNTMADRLLVKFR